MIDSVPQRETAVVAYLGPGQWEWGSMDLEPSTSAFAKTQPQEGWCFKHEAFGALSHTLGSSGHPWESQGLFFSSLLYIASHSWSTYREGQCSYYQKKAHEQEWGVQGREGFAELAQYSGECAHTYSSGSHIAAVTAHWFLSLPRFLPSGNYRFIISMQVSMRHKMVL